jgi:phage head maturation protease
MNKCTVCGMENNANPAHGSSYKGIGAHGFTPQPPEGVDVYEDIVVIAGGEVKSVGDGNKFEGYLVRFSSADDPDLVGDYFTKATEFFVEDGATIPILYDHGLNATMKKTKIGRATVSYDDEGLFIKGELEVADNYKKFVDEIKKKLIDKGKAGLSSGAASHMVSRKQVKKGINELLHWGIAEASVTPAPTEPKLVAQSLKSYFDTREDPMIEGEDGTQNLGTKATKATEPPANEGQERNAKSDTDDDPEETLARTINSENFAKGLFEEKLKEKTPSVWEIRSVLDQAYSDIAKAASVSEITGVTVDVEAKVKESKLEEAAREIPLVVKQIEDWVEKGGSSNDSCGGGKYFYLRSFDTLFENDEESVKGGLGNGLLLDEHSERVVHAVEEFANLGASILEQVKALEQRCIKKIEYRSKDPVKSGRTLSKATINKLTTIKQQNQANLLAQQELEKSLDNLLGMAEPNKAATDAAQVLQMEFALTRNQSEIALQDLPLS